MEGPTSGELPIKTESDIVACRKAIRECATSAGFGVTDVTRIVTAVSELARNVYVHADHGIMRWSFHAQPGKIGIELVFQDQGQGIDNVDQAMLPGYSTAKSMGMGLPGVKRLMDEMEVTSEVGAGTTVKVRKWARA
ncbi:MAG: anti-sigma regulatory factor [Methylococcaceae bacterium]|nr:MAG: anti-sigma regulatory factor [Methylococcaceae bacterium]